MLNYKYDRVIKYKLSAKLMSPMHIGGSFGDNEEVLTDPDTGIPFVQASTLAGLLRDISDRLNGVTFTDQLFGKSKEGKGAEESDTASRIKVSDGIMDEKTVRLETRPNVSVDRDTGTVKSENNMGHKFDITYVSPDAEFIFYLYLFEDSLNKDGYEEKVRILLGGLRNGNSIGSKKSSGAGRFVLNRIETASFDLTTDEGRSRWISEEDEKKTIYKDITVDCVTDKSDVKYDITVLARTEGPIQIKGVAMSVFGKDAPDSENIKNWMGECIIPGTSVRGAIRSQMEKIAAYIGKDEVISKSFGYVAKEQANSSSGNLIFNDCVIGSKDDYKSNPVRNRIHIDKFTGGVMSQAFFKEKNANGDLSLKIQILNRNDPDRTLGLLLFALRDLAIKSFSLGNGYATGKGFVDVTKIEIENKEDNHVSAIAFDDEKSLNENAIVMRALSALREV